MKENRNFVASLSLNHALDKYHIPGHFVRPICYDSKTPLSLRENRPYETDT